jgi:hypothetical protein
MNSSIQSNFYPASILITNDELATPENNPGSPASAKQLASPILSPQAQHNLTNIRHKLKSRFWLTDAMLAKQSYTGLKQLYSSLEEELTPFHLQVLHDLHAYGLTALDLIKQKWLNAEDQLAALSWLIVKQGVAANTALEQVHGLPEGAGWLLAKDFTAEGLWEIYDKYDYNQVRFNALVSLLRHDAKLTQAETALEGLNLLDSHVIATFNLDLADIDYLRILDILTKKYLLTSKHLELDASWFKTLAQTFPNGLKFCEARAIRLFSLSPSQFTTLRQAHLMNEEDICAIASLELKGTSFEQIAKKLAALFPHGLTEFEAKAIVDLKLELEELDYLPKLKLSSKRHIAAVARLRVRYSLSEIASEFAKGLTEIEAAAILGLGHFKKLNLNDIEAIRQLNLSTEQDIWIISRFLPASLSEIAAKLKQLFPYGFSPIEAAILYGESIATTLPLEALDYLQPCLLHDQAHLQAIYHLKEKSHALTTILATLAKFFPHGITPLEAHAIKALELDLDDLEDLARIKLSTLEQLAVYRSSRNYFKSWKDQVNKFLSGLLTPAQEK